MLRTSLEVISSDKKKDIVHIKADVKSSSTYLACEIACLLMECFKNDKNSTLYGIDKFMDFLKEVYND